MKTKANFIIISQDEVDEFREQLALFKQRLNQQEIINDRLMRRSMNARISIFTKWGVASDAITLLFMPLVFWAFHMAGASWYMGFYVVIAIIVELAYNIVAHCKLQQLFTADNDLLTVRRGLIKFKRNKRLLMLISLPPIMLWVLALCWQLGAFSDDPTGGGVAIGIKIATGASIGLLISFGIYFWEMHRVNRSIREIDELSAE